LEGVMRPEGDIGQCRPLAASRFIIHPVHPHAPAAPMMRTLPRDVCEVVPQIVHVADNVIVERRQCVLSLSAIETGEMEIDPHVARRIFHDNCGFSLKIRSNGRPLECAPEGAIGQSRLRGRIRGDESRIHRHRRDAHTPL